MPNCPQGGSFHQLPFSTSLFLEQNLQDPRFACRSRALSSRQLTEGAPNAAQNDFSPVKMKFPYFREVTAKSSAMIECWASNDECIKAAGRLSCSGVKAVSHPRGLPSEQNPLVPAWLLSLQLRSSSPFLHLLMANTFFPTAAMDHSNRPVSVIRQGHRLTVLQLLSMK